MPRHHTPSASSTTDEELQPPGPSGQAIEQYLDTTTRSSPRDNARLLEMVRHVTSDIGTLKIVMNSINTKLESLQAKSKYATSTPPSSPSSVSSTSSGQEYTPTTNQPATLQYDEEWEPGLIGNFHGDGDDVHAFADRLSVVARIKGVKMMQFHLVTLLKDTALGWYYYELADETRSALNDSSSLDPWCQALIKRFTPSYTVLISQLHGCRYTREDAGNGKKAIDYIHEILRITKGLKWSRQDGLMLAYNHFEAQLRLHLNPTSCDLEQFIEQVRALQSTWYNMYASFGGLSTLAEQTLHQQPPSSWQFPQQRTYQPHPNPRQQQKFRFVGPPLPRSPFARSPIVRPPSDRPPFVAPPYDKSFTPGYMTEEEEQECGYDPPTGSYPWTPSHHAHPPRPTPRRNGNTHNNGDDEARRGWIMAGRDRRCHHEGCFHHH